MKHKIAIIGLGYVGLPLAIEFSKNGYEVVGYDIDQKRVDKLNLFSDLTNEIRAKEIVDYIGNSCVFTTNDEELIECNIFIVTVPTPIDNNKKPDLRPLKNASGMIGIHLSA
jgi:UDP-N-acetyl-D-galactosamine dehydrogenase